VDITSILAARYMMNNAWTMALGFLNLQLALSMCLQHSRMMEGHQVPQLRLALLVMQNFVTLWKDHLGMTEYPTTHRTGV
jgi:hypothetical protein